MAGRGLLITFEGLDGTGKSTQARMLARWLSKQGLPVTVTHQPGGTALGRRLRTLVLRRGPGPAVSPEVEVLLMMADRAQHVAEVVRPALDSGRVVVSDRFADSSVAYQVFGLRMDRALVDGLNRLATGGLEPDLTLWLDLPVGEYLGAAARRGPDRIESRSMEFFVSVHRGYESLAAANPGRYVRIDVRGMGRTQVHAQVREHVFRRLKERLESLRSAGQGITGSLPELRACP